MGIRIDQLPSISAAEQGFIFPAMDVTGVDPVTHKLTLTQVLDLFVALGLAEADDVTAEIAAAIADPRLDGTFAIVNTADPTKKIMFSAATIGASTTRTFILPNKNGTILTESSDSTLAAGFAGTAINDGTPASGGNYRPTWVGGNFRAITNNAAFTFQAPNAAGSYNLEVDITMGASAGAITFTGFVTGHPKGSALTLTSGHKHKLHISKTANGVTATLEACQ